MSVRGVRVVPNMELVSRRFGVPVRRAIEREVDEVIHQASELARAMEPQIRQMKLFTI